MSEFSLLLCRDELAMNISIEPGKTLKAAEGGMLLGLGW